MFCLKSRPVSLKRALSPIDGIEENNKSRNKIRKDREEVSLAD